MADELELPSPLKERWAGLRRDLPFVDKLADLEVELQEMPLSVAEFVRVSPQDETRMVPEAPDVPTDDIDRLSGWSAANADQLRMWSLVDTIAVEGGRETRTCPDCGGARVLTCPTCLGPGRVHCHSCGGSGSQGCTHCGGSGRRTVTRSGGRTDSEPCSSCGGSGRQICWHCHGHGQLTCSTCDGSGRVVCQTCSPAGTVDVYIRRTFVASVVGAYTAPVTLPGFPQAVSLPVSHVQMAERDATVPFDFVTDRGRLNGYHVAQPDARLFFIRSATAQVYTVRDARSHEVAATMLPGKPEPILTVHQLPVDPDWSPDKERRKAQIVTGCYVLVGPLVFLGFLLAGMAGLGILAGLGVLATVALVDRHPVRTLRLAFVGDKCPKHDWLVTVHCSKCGRGLCDQCLWTTVRCDQCGQVVSKQITHVVEDGKWVGV